MDQAPLRLGGSLLTAWLNRLTFSLKPEAVNLTVPDHLTLLSRNEVKNRTGASGSDTLEANRLSVLPMVGGGQID